MNDSDDDLICDLVRELPLKRPSDACDEKVFAILNSTKQVNEKRIGITHLTWGIATAASLLIGFFAGTQLGKTDSTQRAVGANRTNVSIQDANSQVADRGHPAEAASNHFELIDGESETFIVRESLQWQDKTPIRRVETLTNKRVLVNDDQTDPKEIEIPIRKVIYTLADSI